MALMGRRIKKILESWCLVGSENYWSFYPSEPFTFALIHMRHPVGICNMVKGVSSKIQLKMCYLSKAVFFYKKGCLAKQWMRMISMMSKKLLVTKLNIYVKAKLFRSNVLRHHFYLPKVIMQVPIGNGVLNRLVLCLKCIELKVS